MRVLKLSLQYKRKVRDSSGSLSGPDSCCAYVPSAAAWNLSEGNESKFTPFLFVSYDFDFVQRVKLPIFRPLTLPE